MTNYLISAFRLVCIYQEWCGERITSVQRMHEVYGSMLNLAAIRSKAGKMRWLEANDWADKASDSKRLVEMLGKP